MFKYQLSMTKLVSLFLIITLFCGAYLTPLLANPLVNQSDSQSILFDIQYLKHRGLIDGQYSTWPLSEAELRKDLSRAKPVTDKDQVVLNRLNQLLSPDAPQHAVTLTEGFDGLRIRNRDIQNRNGANIIGQTQFNTGPVFSRLSGQYQSEDNEWTLDGSYQAIEAKNWIVSWGAVDRFWGSGQNYSLLLSNNSRPLPGISIQRRHYLSSNNWWLSWMGPWDFNLFLAQLENDRPVEDARLLGHRLTFRPHRNLEVGLSRTIMFGGSGQSENFTDTIFRAPDTDEESNQASQIDFAWHFKINDVPTKLVYEVYNEDFSFISPGEQAGQQLSLSFLAKDVIWFGEWSSTLANGQIFGRQNPNVIYRHGTYASGPTFQGDSFAHAMGADSRQLGLGFMLTGDDSYFLKVMLQYFLIDYNPTETVLSQYAEDEFLVLLIQNQVRFGPGFVTFTFSHEFASEDTVWTDDSFFGDLAQGAQHTSVLYLGYKLIF